MKRSASDPIRTLLGLVAEDLEAVGRYIDEALSLSSPAVNELLVHVSRYGGKRLRPAVVSLMGRAVGRCGDEHHRAGAVCELIHLASLVHDDVLDDASQRRQKPTVNALHGDHLPILLGDVLYAQAFVLASSLPDSMTARVMAETSTRLCVGEIEQNRNAGSLSLDEADYFRIIEGKTASLYVAGATLGAHYGGADESVRRRLEDYGRHMGVAFQIIDDVLDLVGDEERVGKSLGTDLLERKATLPLIHLVGRLDEAEQAELDRILDGEGDVRADLRQRFDLAEDLDYSRTTAADFVEKARSCLDVLPASPYRDALWGLGDSVLLRDR